MNCLLVNPPQIVPNQPPLALACLAAYLKSQSVKVNLIDANVESYHYFLDKSCLESAKKRILQRIKVIEINKNRSSEDVAEWNYLQQLKKQAPLVMDHLESSLEVYKVKELFYQPDLLLWANKVLAWALELAMAPYYPTSLKLMSFDMRHSPNASQDIITASEDETGNPYISFYKERLIPRLRSLAPRVVGISVSCITQLIPAITLARVIKEENSRVHVILGGPCIIELRPNLENQVKLFRYVDSFALYEGEETLLRLINQLAAGSSLGDIPNLLYWRNNKINKPKPAILEKQEKIHPDRLPVPDFSDLPLDLYFTLELVLPVRSASGCYWHRCAFCSRYKCLHGKTDPYVPRKAENLVRDMVAHYEQYGVKKFFIVDECLEPGLLSEFTTQLLESGYNFEWYSVARFDKQVTRELCRQAFLAGCRKLFMSIESGSDKILRLMGKGTDINSIVRIIKDLRAEGIVLHINIIVGFPGETTEEFNQTSDLILSLVGELDHPGFSYAVNRFTLTQQSMMMENPANYGITKTSSLAGELSTHLYYQTEQGFDYEQRSRLKSNLERQIARKLTKSYQGVRNDGVNSFLYSCLGLKS